MSSRWKVAYYFHIEGLVTKLLTGIEWCLLGKARSRHKYWESLVVETGLV